MNKFWLVCKHEYLRHVRTKRFLFGLLSMPIFFVVIISIGFLSARLGADLRPVGFVDPSGVLLNPEDYHPDTGDFTDQIRIIKFSSEEEGRDALASNEIQGLFILANDYFHTGQVQLISKEALDSSPINIFRGFVIESLLKSQPTNLAERLESGPQMIVKAIDQERQTSENNILGILAPLLSGILLMIAITTSGGYLVQAITDEKENRTIEILLTSLSHNQFMAGKIVGNLSVGLSQLFIWLATALVSLRILQLSKLPFFANIGDIHLDFLWITAATFLPAFIMVAALMAMVGASAAEVREAQQISGLFTLPLVIPLWALPAIIETPNSPLAVALSLIPFTAPITLPMRVVYTNVPTWQIIVSIVILIASALAAIRMASRAFRLGMLRYGKRLRLREIIRQQPI